MGRVQSLFEHSITSTETNSEDLITLNKEFIGKFIQKIDGFKHRSVSLTHERKEQVNAQFQSKQQELTNLLNPRPQQIDFSDADDKPLDNSKGDHMLEATIRQRALDIDIPPPTSSQTHKWFSESRGFIKPKNIKIGDEIKPTKKVAWADDIESNAILSSDHVSMDSFFKKLKQKSSSDQKNTTFEDDRFIIIERKIDEMHDMIKLLVDRLQH